MSLHDEIKKQINERGVTPFCNPREIWWSSIGLNVGSEEDGKNELFERPVLIINVFNRHMIRIAPLTSKNKEDKHHVAISYNHRAGSVILSQTKTISPKRLSRKLCRLDNKQFTKIINRLKTNIT